MSWFMATIYDWFMRDLEIACGAAWRAELLHDVRGEVLEIGAGTGRNLDHYEGVERLVLAEPDPHMQKKLAARVAREPESRRARSIEIVSWSAESLAAPDASFDVVVATLVLCSVGDVGASLREIRRVLRPGGTFVFLEHVASPDPKRLAWQRRLEPAWKRLAGNCHLCRDAARSIEEAGFHIDRITRESARKALPIVRPTIRGRARA
ncbi:MAG: class I SAM-dependent methyltransferase [Labilithrix sp.]|nr:class I SAM-dependent methyltransferase [Labilithrix sp.]